ncbi:hypothetical protein LZ016_14300 [Sphingomonas sp. SM33]|uniref:Lipoprotein n=1 Tax=Sphingomonas telluris TaxID=2907998 RepID=A0ABS9VQK2_9SPHN|nr:hypothetical protein [Sphingomonas telluris]MCH8617265.1 hypothetical protein [Sphingomonas telluris]
MSTHRLTASVLMLCLALQACSSRPREFTPELARAPDSQSDFETAYGTCQQLLVEGKLDSSGRGVSAAAGAGAGAGTAAVGAATATAVGGYGGLALASATIVLLPFAVLGGAWGMSRMKRAKKEHAIQTALRGCLHERGYEVASWTKAPKKKGVPVADLASK